MTHSERRDFPRLEVQLPVTLRYAGRLIPATTLNISCGGMLLTTEGSNVTTNAPVEVIFDLSATQRDLTLRGDIVRIAAEQVPQVGIRFTNFYAAGYQALERYIRKAGKQ